ncbi:MAG: dihydrolipoamide acetyltransferase family protein [Salinivirgaceae bacterium]
MSTFEIKMPKMGESVQEATITKWFIEKGQTVEEDDTLLEIATDKVDSEVPSPVDGKVVDIKYKVGDVVPVNEVIAIIDLTGEAEVAADEAQDETPKEKEETPEQQDKQEKGDRTEKESEKETTNTKDNDELEGDTDRFYSPLVKNIARKENIALSELEKIEGTGTDGRVRKQDVLKYLENRGSSSKKEQQPAKDESRKEPSENVQASVGAQDEIIQMDRMRKVIAERMVSSKRTAAHVTSMVEADVENLVRWRNKQKSSFADREGIKLTFMPMFIEAVSKALKDFPLVNVSVKDDTIIKKKDHNIGIAVALPNNNLIVPVIKQADRKNLTGLAHDLNDLATRARSSKLSMDDIEGGTFSITNFGSFGNTMGTPIINLPESAILAVGTIEKKPAVLETEHGDIIVARHKMFLSLTYDHRVIDGALGGAFVKRVADYLSQFDLEQTI